MSSIYIHIPFCQSRCIYCDFFSTTSIAKQEDYANCVLREMELRRNEYASYAGRDVSRARTLSIYIGGGTPSTMPPHLLSALIGKAVSLYDTDENAEITIEANPDDVTDEWIAALKQMPVNRVSMGVQTFHDDILATLRRRHSSQQAIDAVRALQSAGYRNISIDLIYGLPGQTVERWRQDVEQALQLGVPHISAYSLMFEDGTRLTAMRDKGLITEMSDEDSELCYNILCQKLKDAGYMHYEVSNFALPGMHSRHNSGYWTGQPYIGFGAGAHSYDGLDTRRWNAPSLAAYINGIKKGEATEVYETEKLSTTDLYNEFIMTRLRTSQGFCPGDIEQRFGKSAKDYCLRMAKPHLQNGNLVERNDSCLCLSQKGVLVSNDVISDLFK